MHILIIPSEHFVTLRYPVGGIFQLHQAKALHRAHHQVGVIGPGVISPRFLFKSYPYPAFEQALGFPVFRLYKRRVFPQRFASPARSIALYQELGLRLYRIYKQTFGTPDVVHAHNNLFAGLIAQAIRRADGTRYIITEHSSSYAQHLIRHAHRQAIICCMHDASVVTAVSNSLVGRIKDALAIPEMNIGVLSDILDPFFLQGVSRDANKHDGGFIFLNIASLDSNKDHASLIRAFAEHFKDTATSLRIGGDGGLRVNLERLARRLGVENQVRFLGLLDQSSVKREMEKADCFVLASRYETFGVVLIEALACGTPVVATRCGGPLDIVTDANGILVEPGDCAALGAAMIQMFQSRSEFRPDVLRRDCIDRFGEEAFVKSATQFYQQAIQCA